jgi:hypothetical protein
MGRSQIFNDSMKQESVRMGVVGSHFYGLPGEDEKAHKQNAQRGDKAQ